MVRSFRPHRFPKVYERKTKKTALTQWGWHSVFVRSFRLPQFVRVVTQQSIHGRRDPAHVGLGNAQQNETQHNGFEHKKKEGKRGYILKGGLRQRWEHRGHIQTRVLDDDQLGDFTLHSLIVIVVIGDRMRIQTPCTSDRQPARIGGHAHRRDGTSGGNPHGAGLGNVVDPKLNVPIGSCQCDALPFIELQSHPVGAGLTSQVGLPCGYTERFLQSRYCRHVCTDVRWPLAISHPVIKKLAAPPPPYKQK